LEIFVIAGPNGSGKSTAAQGYLPPNATFVNADDIARIGGVSDIAAGRIFLQCIDELAAARADIAVETTLASRSLAHRIVQLKSAGYRFTLVFLWLDNAAIAVARVRERVLAGGHNVPEETIRRRYAAGLRNLFELYMPLADVWDVYDSRGSQGPILIASGGDAKRLLVYNRRSWFRIESEWRNG
jgi:predicted ABC-type ATPase